MRPITEDALRRRALGLGARATVGSQVVNAARTKVALARPAPAAPATVERDMPVAPPVTPQEKTPALDLTPLATAVERIAQGSEAAVRDSAAVMAGVRDALREVASANSQARPTRWVFNIQRDARTGLLERVVATAQFS